MNKASKIIAEVIVGLILLIPLIMYGVEAYNHNKLKKEFNYLQLERVKINEKLNIFDDYIELIIEIKELETKNKIYAERLNTMEDYIDFIVEFKDLEKEKAVLEERIKNKESE